MRLPLVHFLQQPGMDRQLPDRKTVINLHKPLKFFGVIDSYSGFYGDVPITVLEHALQKALKPLQIPQSAGSPAFSGNCSGRTAQVDIDFLIAKRSQLLLEAVKILCRNCHNLWNKPVFPIMLRQDLGDFLVTYCPLGTGRQKWSVVLIYSRSKILMEHVPEQIPGNTLHWG